MSTHRWILGVQALVGLLTLAAALWWWEPPAIPVPWERWQPSGASVGFRIQERKPTVPAQGSVVTLAFAFTSDLHGHLSSTRLLPERKPSGLAHLVPVLRQLRTEHPGLVLLDAGDTISQLQTPLLGVCDVL
jgi:2',3'-cyclic-nucleotide 2'-phosphodiesterase (5'-nucleotidase family)